MKKYGNRLEEKRTFTATLPDGKIETRTSDHYYNFMVAVQNTTGWHQLSWHTTRKLAETKAADARTWMRTKTEAWFSDVKVIEVDNPAGGAK